MHFARYKLLISCLGRQYLPSHDSIKYHPPTDLHIHGKLCMFLCLYMGQKSRSLSDTGFAHMKWRAQAEQSVATDLAFDDGDSVSVAVV